MPVSKTSKLLREVGLIVWLAIALYCALALFTYSPDDPGLTHSGDARAVANLSGEVGAWLADLMFTALGRSAYFLLLLWCVFGWHLHQPPTARQYRGWSYLFPLLGVACALVGAGGLEYLYFPFSVVDGIETPPPFYEGGIIGSYGAAKMLDNFGLLGGTVVFIVLLITGITLAAQVSWFRLMDVIGYQVFAFGGWCKGQLERRADRKAGAKVRRQRKVAVKQINAEISGRKPPHIAARAQPTAQSNRRRKESQRNLFSETASEFGGSLPPLSLLEPPPADGSGYSKEELEAMSRLLVKKLKDFNVEIAVEAVQPGPVITRFEVEPAPGIKASQIVALSRDLARSLSVESVRVVDNIAGKSVIGLEIPNQSREVVRLVEGLSARDYETNASPLTMVLGKDIAGNPIITDLMKMPHVLIAGTTGSGKSVCVNALILSMLFKATAEKVRFIMVDPKFLELSVYDGIPHLLTPVITDMSKAANALRWCIQEMDRRFRMMAAISVRNIAAYNKKIAAAKTAGKPLTDPFSVDDGATVGMGGEGGEFAATNDGEGQAQPRLLREMPYIVVIVDELADLIMVVGKKIEEIIIRIAQRARAAGIHLILATQRPSVDVVTGLIKANVPTRIAFQVSSRADSRTVIDQMGAEQLLGQGDMLFLPPGSGFTQRVHGAFVSDEEVTHVVRHIRDSSRGTQYLDEVIGEGDAQNGGEGGDGEADPLYDEAVKFVTQNQRASISALQRALRVGYNRAARMIEVMEESGVVSASDNGKREVLAAPPPPPQ